MDAVMDAVDSASTNSLVLPTAASKPMRKLKREKFYLL